MRAAIGAAQKLILDNEATLTTLTISIVCPSNHRWFVCSAIVGDSNAYVYSRKQKTVFELTQGRSFFFHHSSFKINLILNRIS